MVAICPLGGVAVTDQLEPFHAGETGLSRLVSVREMEVALAEEVAAPETVSRYVSADVAEAPIDLCVTLGVVARGFDAVTDLAAVDDSVGPAHDNPAIANSKSLIPPMRVSAASNSWLRS